MNTKLLINTGIEVESPSFSTFMLREDKKKTAYLEKRPEILVLTSYPPRECGIATYSQDLLKALNNKFSQSFALKVCALEAGNMNHDYPAEVKYILNTNEEEKYSELADAINQDKSINVVLIQHEFGFFEQKGKDAFMQLLHGITKPIIIVFHTILPNPNEILKEKVKHIANVCASVIVMTQNASQLLISDYDVSNHKIAVIEHGTHLVSHLDKTLLKIKHNLAGKKVLSTFGLLSSGKSIETTLMALPTIIKKHPDVVFLVIGKTHPEIIKSEGEKYRDILEAKVAALSLQEHVKFINSYLLLPDLLEYLQLTDIYLFTSNDPNQAVSGTFSYAMSCGCPIISTPIPHAKEVLTENTGIIIDFQNTGQLAEAVNLLMSDESLRQAFSANTLQRMVPTAWENSAIAHALLIQNIAKKIHNADMTPSHTKSQAYQNIFQSEKNLLQYSLPIINLEHIKNMTTAFGMIQFAKINEPDINSGYTLDDNARALIAMCMHYEETGDDDDIQYIHIYLHFITYCMQPEGEFLNYIDEAHKFTDQNQTTNLSDSNGRAIWALGYLISKQNLYELPDSLILLAEKVLQQAMPLISTVHFMIKGLYYANLNKKSGLKSAIIQTLANRLVQMYRHESEQNWQWYESYLTYANAILPEALLCAWQDTKDIVYKETAKASFDFLLSLTFNAQGIKVISNKTWLKKGQKAATHGEQPIDVAYTILAMSRFYDVFKEESYLQKMEIAFNWFLGNNHLHQIIYNPCTGGCYDGLEEYHVNLNQGAESTLSYLMARLNMEKYAEKE
jgi:glycosyltransferase involved in cell wall biosynthesis